MNKFALRIEKVNLAYSERARRRRLDGSGNVETPQGTRVTSKFAVVTTE